MDEWSFPTPPRSAFVIATALGLCFWLIIKAGSLTGEARALMTLVWGVITSCFVFHEVIVMSQEVTVYE